MESFAKKTLPDVIIDFSSPHRCIEALNFCVENQIPFITGTTGLTSDQQEHISTSSRTIPIVQAANFSVGVHLLAKAVAQTAAATQNGDWDIELYEAHHRNKVDAPGGTALFLGKTAAQARGMDFEKNACLERCGKTGKRTENEIGFQVLRGGSIVGTHTVSFCAEGELIELTHKALDRTIFARGALRGATWIVDKSAALYGMEDVLFSG